MPHQALQFPFPPFRQVSPELEVEPSNRSFLPAAISGSRSSSEASMAVSSSKTALPTASTVLKDGATATSPRRAATHTKRKPPSGGSCMHFKLANTANGLELSPVPPSPPPSGPLPPTPVESDRGRRPSVSGQFNSASDSEVDTCSTDSSTVLDTPDTSFQSGSRTKSKSRDRNRPSSLEDVTPSVTMDRTDAGMRKGQGEEVREQRVSFSSSKAGSSKVQEKSKADSKRNSMRDDDSVLDPVPRIKSPDPILKNTTSSLREEARRDLPNSSKSLSPSAMERTASEQSILSNNKLSSLGKSKTNKYDAKRQQAIPSSLVKEVKPESNGEKTTTSGLDKDANAQQPTLSREESFGMVTAAADSPVRESGDEDDGTVDQEEGRQLSREQVEEGLDSDEYTYSDDGDTAQPHSQPPVAGAAPYGGARFKTKRYDDDEMLASAGAYDSDRGDGVGLGVMGAAQQQRIPKWLSEEPQFNHGGRGARNDGRGSSFHNEPRSRAKGGLRAAAGFQATAASQQQQNNDYHNDVMSPAMTEGGLQSMRSFRNVAPTNDSRSSLGQEPMSRNHSNSNVYRKAGLRSDLADWAPSAKPAVINDPALASHNLPEWSSLRAGDPTSKPISRIRRDLDWSMRRLMSEETFEKLISDPLGRYHFRQFLLQKTGTEHKLDLYFDVSQYARQTESIRTASDALHDVYLALDSDSHVDLPENLAFDFYSTLRKHYELKTTVAPLQQHLLQSLYKREFQSFVKAKLVEHNKVRLGTLMDDSGTGASNTGLGDCFCLTNPRLRENPIVLVSPGFTALTGYPATSIIGRNCRFLSGPGTAPNSIQRIRDALNAGSSCTELLLNYKRDGQPFFNLLTILPLRDATGNLVYFIGGQTEVTSQLASSKGLSWLLGGGEDILPVSVTAQSQHNTINGVEVSPLMARYLQETDRMRGLGAHDDGGSDDGYSQAGASSYRGGEDDFDGPSLARPRMQAGQRQRSYRAKGTAAGYQDPNANSRPGRDVMAPDLAPSSSVSSNRSDAGGATSTGGLFGRLFGGGGGGNAKKSKAGGNQRMSSSSDAHGVQKLAGAEQLFQRDPHSLEDQMDFFSTLYSKLIIFKRAKREVVFVTRAAITYFNLPTTTWYDIHSSPLIHTDLLSLLRGSDKAETKSIRAAVQEAIRQGTHISIQTAIRTPPTTRKGAFLDKVAELGNGNGRTPLDANGEPLRFTTMHITPLKDRENSSFAFVAVVA